VFRVGDHGGIEINYMVGTEISEKSTPYGLVPGVITDNCQDTSED
jgi:hypothetical protein